MTKTPPMHDNTLGVFDNSPDDTARRVARQLFERGFSVDKVARATGRKESDVRTWYQEWREEKR